MSPTQFTLILHILNVVCIPVSICGMFAPDYTKWFWGASFGLNTLAVILWIGGI